MLLNIYELSLHHSRAHKYSLDHTVIGTSVVILQILLWQSVTTMPRASIVTII